MCVIMVMHVEARLPPCWYRSLYRYVRLMDCLYLYNGIVHFAHYLFSLSVWIVPVTKFRMSSWRWLDQWNYDRPTSYQATFVGVRVAEQGRVRGCAWAGIDNIVHKTKRRAAKFMNRLESCLPHKSCLWRPPTGLVAGRRFNYFCIKVGEWSVN